ncbi:DUF2680 domain-containing protein [Filobacillus milosensis]|uniref:DUF2680 domain-containing protein n=2 Tax=Filobacillus milosensis TaxID=94137 RepID=A0A4Y8IMS3_9BACI|nr:DUF2680 domain-containing protein [Filobacillus milosensis]
MTALQKEAFEHHKKIVNKYVKYGVYSEEKVPKYWATLKKCTRS